MPPVFKRIGKNLTSGMTRNFNFAANLKMTSNATPIGAKSFLSLCPRLCSVPGGSE